MNQLMRPSFIDLPSLMFYLCRTTFQVPKDASAEANPAFYRSKKTGRGPLSESWEKDALQSGAPFIRIYKLLTFQFKWFGVQTRVEKVVSDFERGIFTRAHREVWLLQDEWHDLVSI